MAMYMLMAKYSPAALRSIVASGSGTFEHYKTIPLYSWADIKKALPIAKKVQAVYRPPVD